jgi:hypothetical protein
MVNDDRAVTVEKDPGPQTRVPCLVVTISHAIFTAPPRIAAQLPLPGEPAYESTERAVVIRRGLTPLTGAAINSPCPFAATRSFGGSNAVPVQTSGLYSFQGEPSVTNSSLSTAYGDQAALECIRPVRS